MSDSNGLLLTEVIKRQAQNESGKKSIAKSTNPAFIKGEGAYSEVKQEENSIKSVQSEQETDKTYTFSATINSENRVYVNTIRGEYEFGGDSSAEGIYDLEIIFYNSSENNQDQESAEVSDEKDSNHLIDIGKDKAKVRCSCPHYRFYYSQANKENGFLKGGDFPKYTYKRKTDRKTSKKSVQPNTEYGMCKHLVHFVSSLLNSNKIEDSTGEWKRVVSKISQENINLNWVKPKAKPKTKQDKNTSDKPNEISNKLKVNLSSIVNNEFSKSYRGRAKKSTNRGERRYEMLEKPVIAAHSNLKKLDKIISLYGEDRLKDKIELDNIIKAKLNIDNSNISLKSLRDKLEQKYNNAVENYLKQKYHLENNKVDNQRKKDIQSILNQYKIFDKSGKRFRYVDPTSRARSNRKDDTSLAAQHAALRDLDNKYRIDQEEKAKAARQLERVNSYIAKLAREKSKSEKSIKRELQNSAKKNGKEFIPFVLELSRQNKRNTQIVKNSENSINKNNDVSINKPSNKVKKQSLDRVKNLESEKKYFLNTLKLPNLSLKDKINTISRDLYSIDKELQRIKGDEYESIFDDNDKLKMKYLPFYDSDGKFKKGYASIFNQLRQGYYNKQINDKRVEKVTKVSKTISKKDVSKKPVKKTVTTDKKNKEKDKNAKDVKKTKTTTIERPTVTSKKSNEFDFENYDFTANRTNEGKGAIIIPPKPDKSSNMEEKFFYVKSLASKINELEQLKKRIINKDPSVKSVKSSPEDIDKLIDRFSLDLTNGVTDYNIPVRYL